MEDLAHRYSDLTVAVTGSSGYLAAALMDQLPANVATIIPVSRTSQVAGQRRAPLLADVRTRECWDRLVERADVIFHLAGNTSVHEADRARLLAPAGVLIFEDPYLGDMLAKTWYDQIYDEHVFMFSATSVANIFGPHGLELIDVSHQATPGGSMRYTLARRGACPAGPAVSNRLAQEPNCGLHRAVTYDRFRRACETFRASLQELLTTVQREGKRVVGYGATSKSATVTNYCGLGPEQIAFIADTTPIKQGKLTPGMHTAKERTFSANGGKWITYAPHVQVLEAPLA